MTTENQNHSPKETLRNARGNSKDESISGEHSQFSQRKNKVHTEDTEPSSVNVDGSEKSQGSLSDEIGKVFDKFTTSYIPTKQMKFTKEVQDKINDKVKKLKEELHKVMDENGWIDCMVSWNIIDAIFGEDLEEVVGE